MEINLHSSIAVSDDQVIRLEGGQNFRGVGGYPTLDGRRLRRGLIWRSAALDRLTAADVDVIKALGIKTIADLRQPLERQRHPTHECLTNSTTLMTWEIERGIGSANYEKILADIADWGPDKILRQLYRQMLTDHAAQFGDLYRAIANGDAPVLVHCAAGKDRTGLAVAVLLELVGVERAYIVADYSKTDQLLDWQNLAIDATGAGIGTNWLEKLTPNTLNALRLADARYIEGTLEDLEAQHGSVADYARQVVAVDDDIIARLQQVLLEDVPLSPARG